MLAAGYTHYHTPQACLTVATPTLVQTLSPMHITGCTVRMTPGLAVHTLSLSTVCILCQLYRLGMLTFRLLLHVLYQTCQRLAILSLPAPNQHDATLRFTLDDQGLQPCVHLPPSNCLHQVCSTDWASPDRSVRQHDVSLDCHNCHF
jgi:hypothetical protein